MNLRKPLAAVALTGALALSATPAQAHTGHHVAPIGSRHYISLYRYEQPYAVRQVNLFNPFCWGGASWIRTIDARTGARTRSDFVRCW